MMDDTPPPPQELYREHKPSCRGPVDVIFNADGARRIHVSPCPKLGLCRRCQRVPGHGCKCPDPVTYDVYDDRE